MIRSKVLNEAIVMSTRLSSDDRRELRQQQPAKPLPRRQAFEVRGFVQLARHPLQARRTAGSC